jgi:hypothetical protein
LFTFIPTDTSSVSAGVFLSFSSRGIFPPFC